LTAKEAVEEYPGPVIVTLHGEHSVAVRP
jgi:hypothetical protein